VNLGDASSQTAGRRLYKIGRGARGRGKRERERICAARVCTLTIILVPCRLGLIPA